MSVLTSGRSELSCYNNIGGIRNVYFFNYVSYAYSQIVGGKGGALTSFPTTTIYKFEIQDGSFNETINNDDEGIYYEQSLNFTLIKQDLTTTTLINTLKDLDLRFIVEFNDGSFRIGGLYNGTQISTVEINSGGSKGSFNGYNISANTRESYSASWISDLSSVGFDI